MRILYLTVGGSVHDQRFLVKLVERGYETHYAFLMPAGREFGVAGVRAHFLGYEPRSGQSQASKSVMRVRAYQRFRRLLRELRPDVLHTGFVQTVGLMGAVSGFHPTLLMPWGSDILVYPERSKAMRAVTRFVLRRADMITCDCLGVRERILALVDYPSDRLVVFPWGVDLRSFRPDDHRRDEARRTRGWGDREVLLMTRNFYPVYGIEHFIRAMPTVVRQCPGALAVLAGAGPLESQLRQLVASLGLKGHVSFLGSVPNADLPGLLNAADIYVSSSLSDGTSLSLLEALASALPAVVTDVPANLEWVRDGVHGRIARRGDAITLAQAILDVLSDKGRRREMGRVGHALALERADWEKNFAKLEGMYHKLTRERE